MLELTEDLTLVARAVDPEGQPVRGVIMTLIRGTESHSRPLPPTDARGLTRMPHVQDWFRHGETISLEPALFGGVGERVVVRREDVSTEPVDVAVPASGSLEVRLLGPDGRPWELAEGSRASVLIESADEPGAGIGMGAVAHTIELDRDGRAIAEPVPCGHELRVRVFAGIALEKTIAGPSRAGERVRVEVPMPADVPLLVGRVLDAAGSPVRGVFHLQCEVRHGNGTWVVGTRADGSFRLALGERTVGEPITVFVALLDERLRGTGQVARVRLAEPVHAGINAAGNLVLGDLPLLVAGRVERLDGTPVEPPTIEVQRTHPSSTSVWEPAWELRPKTPGGGRFVLHGFADEGKRYRLHVLGDRAPHEPVEFAPGTEGLVLRVGAAGRVAARFLVDPATPWRRLRYRLMPATESPAGDPPSWFERDRESRGRPRLAGEGPACEWTGLAPGLYRLTVHCPGFAEPLVDFSEIAVPAGAAAADSRLEAIDLRGRVRKLRVRVTDAAGDPVHAEEEAAVVIRGAAEEGAPWYGGALAGEAGEVELLAVRPVDLLIVAPGFRSKDVANVFEDTAVTLERAPEVRLRLRGGLPSLPEGVVLSLGLWVPSHPAPNRRVMVERASSSRVTRVSSVLLSPGQGSTLGPAGDVTVQLPDDRERRLRLVVYREGGVPRLVDVTPARLDPAGLRDGQVIELRCDPAALRAAIAKVAGG